MKNLLRPGKEEVSQTLLAATSKKNNLLVAGLAFLGTLVGFILTTNQSPVISYFFLGAMILELVVFFLVAFDLYFAAQQAALFGLWILFTLVGVARADIFEVMLAGYLVVMIIAGFSFHLRGIILAATASAITTAAIGIMNVAGVLEPLIPPVSSGAKIVVNLLVLFIGGAYLITTLDILRQSFREARDYQQRYQALFIDSLDGIVILDLDFNMVDVNQTALVMTGYAREEVMGLNADQLVIPNEAYTEAKALLKKRRKVSAFEHKIQQKSGEMIDVESMPTLVMDETGEVLFIQVQMRDIQARKQVEKYLSDYKQRYDALFDRADYGFLLIDMDMNMVAANQQAADMVRCSLRELGRKPVKEILKKRSYRQMEADVEKLLSTGDLPPRQYQMGSPQGHTIWVEANLGLVDSGEGHPLYMQWIIRDISDQKEREQQLLNSLQEMETLAMTDPLTGLQNRRSIETYSKVIIDRAENENNPFCVILIDVDQLKTINDSLGHQVGDQALSQLAGVLTRSKRRDDVVGRWGGDEFLIILPNTGLSDAEVAAHRIQNRIAKVWVGEGGKTISLAVSMGVAGTESLPADEPIALDALIVLADEAMYQAKDENSQKITLSR